jgi:hypothetical protein
MKGLKKCVSKVDIQIMNEYLLFLNKFDKKHNFNHFDDIDKCIKRDAFMKYELIIKKIWTSKRIEDILEYIIEYPKLMESSDLTRYIEMIRSKK